ncbi:MAG: hypothetical protein CVT67_04205 [Actinobacteria bacterium HGW-Actinobacteria-7]|nr:MAG: hypothetical protein CVT67_04205 [Actinobacteria bacterium HGW-Actinobacteria-7]
MQIVIPTVGTRGDVQPYVALGVGLRKAGHDVRIITLSQFESFVTGEGLEFAPTNAEFLELLNTPEGKKAISGGNPLGVFKRVMPMLRAMLDEIWEASRDADAIVYHPKTLASEHVAAKLGVPAIRASVVPLYTPTAEFPVPIINAGRSLGGIVNHATWGLFLMGVYAPYVKMVDGWRADSLGLPSAKQQPAPIAQTLYGYSEHIVPRPADWPDDVVITGTWFLEAETGWTPSGELTAFLDRGDPPVYVGFGSMPSQDPLKVAETVISALRKAGLRGVLASGFGGMEASAAGDDILVIDAAPHSWLFPRMSAVVHHGGAGTTAAGLRAGRPTLVVPTGVDQPFWGARVAALGAGPKPLPAKRLTVDGLASALRELTTDTEMQMRAGELGRQISQEDGVARAIAEIEKMAQGHASA